jgi:hypothetical protein
MAGPSRSEVWARRGANAGAASRASLRAFPPQLRNTDGDAFLLTTDHFAIAPGEAGAVERCLAAIPGVEAPDPEDDPRDYVFLREGNPMHKSWDDTVVERAWIEGSALHLETNSRERADALRAALGFNALGRASKYGSSRSANDGDPSTPGALAARSTSS